MSEPAASIYLSWRRGRCPCCGGPLVAWEDRQGTVTECLTLGELVRMCGRCVANEHGRESDRFVPVLLECIARRTDAPLDALLDEIGNEALASERLDALLDEIGNEALASERQAELDREAWRP
jgi:hypothetical protein